MNDKRFILVIFDNMVVYYWNLRDRMSFGA